MERQLKERLIGAAVLVAAAVIMVPEMFSGPRVRPESTSESVVSGDSTSAGQVKTYRIELQSAQRTTPEPAPVDTPAERPQTEVPIAPESTQSAQSSAASATSVVSNRSAQSISAASTTSVATLVKPAEVKPTSVAQPAKPAASATAKPEVAKTVEPTKAVAGDWVVQVGSFSAQDKAQQIAGTLKGQGYSASVGPVKVGAKTLYRVRVGAATERSSADATLQKLKSTYPDASVVAANR